MFWLAEVFNGRYTQEEMRRFEQWARRERAATVVGTFKSLGRVIKTAAAGPAALVSAIRRWHRKREAVRELSAMSDHILRDIGLSRGQIRSVVEELSDGRPPVQRVPQPSAARKAAEARVPGKAADQAATDEEWQRAA